MNIRVHTANMHGPDKFDYEYDGPVVPTEVVFENYLKIADEMGWSRDFMIAGLRTMLLNPKFTERDKTMVAEVLERLLSSE